MMEMEHILRTTVLPSSSSSTEEPAISSASGLFRSPLFSSIVAFMIAQLIKFFSTWAAQLLEVPIAALLAVNVPTASQLAVRPSLGHVWYPLYKEKRFDAMQLIGSGGMPSSHSATVTALAVSVGLQDGFGGSLFAIATIIACVVMHDAFGVRLHAGRQAEVLNQIVFELPEEHPLSDTRPLRELLGHTPLQVVAGAMLGLVTALLAYSISKSEVGRFGL